MMLDIVIVFVTRTQSLLGNAIWKQTVTQKKKRYSEKSLHPYTGPYRLLTQKQSLLRNRHYIFITYTNHNLSQTIQSRYSKNTLIRKQTRYSGKIVTRQIKRIITVPVYQANKLNWFLRSSRSSLKSPIETLNIRNSGFLFF